MRNRALGLDLGQVQDHTALALVEWEVRDDDRHYSLRHLERVALGTGYPVIADHIKALQDSEELRDTTRIVADATGVGRGVIGFFRERGVELLPVVVHAGRQSTVDEWGYHHVPKRELVGIAQVLLQARRLRFAPSLPFVKLLEDELLKFEVKITDAGTDVYGAWREGAHDDLVFALCLATWYGEALAAQRDAPAVYGTVSRLTPDPEVERTAAARRFFGKGQDPKAGGLVVGRNGTGRY